MMLLSWYYFQEEKEPVVEVAHGMMLVA